MMTGFVAPNTPTDAELIAGQIKFGVTGTATVRLGKGRYGVVDVGEFTSSSVSVFPAGYDLFSRATHDSGRWFPMTASVPTIAHHLKVVARRQERKAGRA